MSEPVEYYPARLGDGRLTVVKVTKNGSQRVIEPLVVHISLAESNIKQLMDQMRRGKDVFCEILYDLEKNQNQEFSHKDFLDSLLQRTSEQ